MKLFSRDSIARDIRYNVFENKTVWSLVFQDVQDGIKYISGAQCSNRILYEKLYKNVRNKVEALDGKVKSIYVYMDGKKKYELNYQTAENLVGDILRKQLSLTFKIMVKNKYYEFVVKG